MSEFYEEKSHEGEKFFCPICHYESNLEINPKFCTNCGYPFPRNNEGKLLINQYQIASRNNIHSINPSIQENIYGTQNRRYKWKFWPGFLLPIISIIILGIIQLLLLLLIPFDVSPFFINFIASFVSLGFFFIPLFWIKKYYQERLTWKDRLKELYLPIEKYKGKELAREILLGIFLGLGMQLLIFVIQIIGYHLVFQFYNIDVYSLLNNEIFAQFQMDIPANIWQLFAFILMMAIFVGVPEEVMFRGFVQRSFESKLSKGASLVLTAVFFSLFHIFAYIIYQPVFFYLLLNYLGLSLVLGLIRNWRKDVIATSVGHIIYNITQTVIIYLIFT